eukprot:TRINITY_DN2037_c0_g1_i3.p1 TRINITY_DN2037_c0_g1~~TRINITY_DN2037_c0_g1_i3.p1  ORF type:complete len:968 (+),score=390.05 TRINITY_DN2037_c0_g1_i3:690-3593(+)
MQDEFKPLNTSLGKTLVTLLPLYMKIRTITILRKEGAINIALKPEDMPKPVSDKFHFQLDHASSMYLWITYGFLLCPETLSLPGAMDLCKFALSEGQVTPVFRGTSFFVLNEYDKLFSDYKSKTLNLSKNKKLIKDVQAEAALKTPLKHKERRIYLRQELNSLYRLLSDKPGLLGPKFQLVLCALSMAKEEVFWYFCHLKNGMLKGTKKAEEEQNRDNRISELLFLIDKMTDLINKNRNIIQQYYMEYLKGADRKKLAELCDGNFSSQVGNGVAQICRSIIEELNGIQNGGRYDFKALRLNWLRAEAALSSVQSPVHMMKVKAVVDRINLTVNHTRFVDDIDNLLNQHVSLKGLWFYKDLLQECLTKAIGDGPNQPLHAITFVKLLADAPTNATQYAPDERDEIGRQAVDMADKMIEEITKRTVDLIGEVAKQSIVFDGQLAEINAAYPLLLKRKDYKPPKDFVPPAVPGSESEYRRRPALDRLRLFERNTWQLCNALNEVDTILVYDSVFAPREFLRDKLVESFRAQIRGSVIVEVHDDKHRVIERNIQRPSIIERQIETYMNVLQLVENLVDINIGDLLREVLVQEIWIPAIGRAGTFDWVNAEETDIKFNGASVGHFVTWYSDFISKKLAVPGIVFSPSRKGFVSKTGMPFKAELYTDIVELRSLCNLVGPYGVKIIDRELLKFVLSNVNIIKDYVSHNRQALDELRTNYHNEAACNEALKKIKDCDNFISKSIAIGNALYFREILHEALGEIVELRIPYIFNTISNCFNEYRANTFMSPELLNIDALAADCGIDVGTADQALKKFLSKAIGSADAPLWDLLPFMYAASLNSTIWKEATFNPVIEGHSNNAHTLAKGINSLVVAFKSITTNTPDEKEIVYLLQRFVEVSSVLLLRLARAPKTDKHGPVDFPSMIIFMDKFIKECPLLTQESLESVLPYALLRSEYKTVYRPTLIGGKKEAADVY